MGSSESGESNRRDMSDGEGTRRHEMSCRKGLDQLWGVGKRGEKASAVQSRGNESS